MKNLYILILLSLTSCSAMMPGFYNVIDDIETNSVIKVEIDKEAFVRDTQSVNVTVQIQNKEK